MTRTAFDEERLDRDPRGPAPFCAWKAALYALGVIGLTAIALNALAEIASR